MPDDNVALLLSIVQENKKLLQSINQKVSQLMSQTQSTDQQFQTEMAGIQADMTKQTTVTNSVLVFISGLKDKLAAAISSATGAGATSDELSALQALHTDLSTNTASLVTATTDNTTAANEASAPVEPTTTVDSSTVAASQPTAAPSPSTSTSTSTGDDGEDDENNEDDGS